MAAVPLSSLMLYTNSDLGDGQPLLRLNHWSFPSRNGAVKYYI